MCPGKFVLFDWVDVLLNFCLRPYGTIFANDIFSSGVILSEYYTLLSFTNNMLMWGIVLTSVSLNNISTSPA